MYRQVATRHGPPTELIYDGQDRGGRRRPSQAFLLVFMLPPLVATLLSLRVGPTPGLVGLIATALIGIWWWRRTPKGGVILRVEGGELLVLARATEKIRSSIPLVELVNVELDTRAIQRVEEGNSAIPGLRWIDTKIVNVDTGRVVLVQNDVLRAQKKELPLTTEFVAHMDATEWVGKIRVFLRSHGWVPASERPLEDEEADR